MVIFKLQNNVDGSSSFVIGLGNIIQWKKIKQFNSGLVYTINILAFDQSRIETTTTATEKPNFHPTSSANWIIQSRSLPSQTIMRARKALLTG